MMCRGKEKGFKRKGFCQDCLSGSISRQRANRRIEGPTPSTHVSLCEDCMNIKMTIVLVIAILGLVVLSIVGFLIYKFFTYRTEISLVEDFLITDQWQDIDVKDKLPPLSKDRNNLLVAAPPSYKAFGTNRGIVTPDGTVIELEVEAVDTNGEVHSFKRTGARRTSKYEMATYNPYPELQKGIQIELIRIRANNKLRAPVILWSSYDIKDLP